MTNLERAIKDGYAHIIGEKGKQKITYVSSDSHVENYSDPEEKVRAEFWAELIYKYEYGLLNFIVSLFGMDKQVWLNTDTAIYLTIIPVLWQYIGYYFIIFLTGISKIPEDIYESAKLEGITPFQKTIYITLPMLKDVVVSVVVLVVSGVFRVFDTIYVITKGGPMDSSQLLSTYMYKMAFENYNGGYASAIAVLMIVLGVALTVIIRKLLRADVQD